jgi:hypothetical protein
MYRVYKHVRTVEKNSLKFSFIARFKTENYKKTRKRSRRIMIQGTLYSLSMVVLWVCGTIAKASLLITKGGNLTSGLMFNTISPLQGLFNVLIYLIPCFRRKLKSFRRRRGKDDENDINNNDNNNTDEKIRGDIKSPIGTSLLQKMLERDAVATGDTEEEKKDILSMLASNLESAYEEGGNENEDFNNHHHDIIDNQLASNLESASEEGGNENEYFNNHHHDTIDDNHNNDEEGGNENFGFMSKIRVFSVMNYIMREPYNNRGKNAIRVIPTRTFPRIPTYASSFLSPLIILLLHIYI